MLSLLGYLMVITFTCLILLKRLSPFTGLILIPIVFGLMGGFGLELAPLMMEGIAKIAPTAVLLLFAILYFGIMLDTGLFDPLIKKILQIVKGDPLKVIVGSAVLPGIVGFDGDGSSTMMICVTPFLVLYKRLGINPVILAALTIMQIGITTMVPWGGPAGRVASALHLDVTQLSFAVLPGMIVALLYVVFVAYIIGKRERLRLGIGNPHMDWETEKLMAATAAEDSAWKDTSGKRPFFVWMNFGLTVIIMVALVLDVVPAPLLFMLGTAIALVINYPDIQQQRERIAAHAPNVLAVVSMVLAAGIFTGILKGTQMSAEMAQTLVSIIPPALGSHLPVVTAILSVPGLFFLGPDGFYFGILPVLAETAAFYGITPMQIGTASLYGTPFGIMGPLVASVYLLIGMTGVGLGEFQRYTAKWAWMIVVIYILVGLFTGMIPL